MSVAAKAAKAAKARSDNTTAHRVSSDDETSSEDEGTDQNKRSKAAKKSDAKKSPAAKKSPGAKQDFPALNEIDAVCIQEELESILGKLGAMPDTKLQLQQISAQIEEHDELIVSIDEDMEAKRNERVLIVGKIAEVHAQHPLVHSHRCVHAVEG